MFNRLLGSRQRWNMNIVKHRFDPTTILRLLLVMKLPLLLLPRNRKVVRKWRYVSFKAWPYVEEKGKKKRHIAFIWLPHFDTFCGKDAIMLERLEQRERPLGEEHALREYFRQILECMEQQRVYFDKWLNNYCNKTKFWWRIMRSWRFD